MKIVSTSLTPTPLLLDSGTIGTAQRLSITSASELPPQPYFILIRCWKYLIFRCPGVVYQASDYVWFLGTRVGDTPIQTHCLSDPVCQLSIGG